MGEKAIMSATDLIERYSENLHGVLSCFDRIIIVGTLPECVLRAGHDEFFISVEDSYF